MSTTATVSEVRADVDVYLDRALSEPVCVTNDGQDALYIVSARMFHALRNGQREAFSVLDLTDAEMDAIEAAEIPSEHRYAIGS